MSKYKCIVVDDEPLARKIIEDYISEIDDLKLSASLKSGLEAKQYLDNHQIDIVFLDINMPKLSGIDLVRNFDLNSLIIFTTAYPEYAVEAFEYSGFDYLVKPISFERFLKSIDKAKGHLESKCGETESNEFLIIKENKRLYKIAQKQILYLEAYGDYVKVITKDKKYITKDKLSSFVNLVNKSIIQCHRSYYVNINQIEYLEGNHAMVAGDMISISKSYKDSLVNSFKNR